MNATQRGVITLLKSAVTGEALPLPEGFDLETAYSTLHKHHMAALLYEGAALCGISRELPVMQQLLRGYCRGLLISEGQLSEIRRICEAFDKNGIDYLPLKGANMKQRYPKPELRSMGDADILIRLEQREKFDTLLQELGFRFLQETDHELVWQSKQLHLELHKHLIPSSNKDLYPYFGTGWQLAQHRAYGRHAMAPEQEFLYLLTHFAKHYRSGGIGCRHVLDLWVFRRYFPELDEQYLCRELEKLGLLEFYGNLRDLLDYWFGAGEGNARLDHMTEYVFASGSWGDSRSRALAQTLQGSRRFGSETGGKLVYLWSMTFPPVELLRGKYRILKKYPWLRIPVCVYRLFYKLLFQRKKVMRLVSNVEELTPENLQDRRWMLQYVGLDYRF